MIDFHESSIAPNYGVNQPDMSLSEVSPKDKPWDKHRKNADIVSSHYKKGGYDRYSERVNFCSLILDFRLVPKDKEEMKLKLSNAFSVGYVTAQFVSGDDRLDGGLKLMIHCHY